MSDTAQKILKEFERLKASNEMFRQYAELHPECSMEELLRGWEWIAELLQKAIHRTIRDLTCPPPRAKLPLQRER